MSHLQLNGIRLQKVAMLMSLMFRRPKAQSLPEMRQITGDVGENRDRLLAFIER